MKISSSTGVNTHYQRFVLLILEICSNWSIGCLHTLYSHLYCAKCTMWYFPENVLLLSTLNCVALCADAFHLRSHLNPILPGPIPIPSDVCAEFLHGAVTLVMVTWECFIDNLLSECFDVVVNYTEPSIADTSSSSSDGSDQDAIELSRLHKQWPNC